MDEEKPTLIDLFCGAGGFSQGFRNAGFRIVCGIDCFPPAVQTFQKNFPEAKVLERDIKTICGKELVETFGKPNVVIGGPPCEPYTPTNPKRRKDPLERLYDDPIGRLVLHFIRLVGELEPEIFVMENVPAVAEGVLRDALREEFGRIGYEAKFNLLEASRIGVPSERRRMFVSNVRIRLKSEKRKTVWDAIGDLPSPFEPHEIPNHEPVPVPKRVRKKIFKLKWGQAAVYFKGASRVYRNYIKLHPYRPAPTVMGRSRFIHPFEPRILTVRENARLMSFPDDFIFVGGRDTQFDLVGEAVPPLLAQKIAEKILKKL